MDRSKWEYKKLGEVSTMFSGFTPKSEELRSNGKYPYFKVADMNTVGNERELRYTISYIEDSRKYFKKNTIVFPKNGAAIATNKKRILAFDSIVDLNTAGIYADDSILSCLYLYYFLQNIDFKEITRGGAVPTLDLKELRNRIINIPPISDQQRIVAELDCLNEMIAVKQEQLKEFDKLAQSIFYDMFGDPMENSHGWKSEILANIVSEDCSISYGIVQPGEDVEDGVPVVRPVDLTSTIVYRNGLKVVDKAISDSYRRTILKGNEILFCVRGTTGIMSFASEELKGCNVTRGITPLSFSEKVDKTYIYYLLMTPYLQSIIAEKTNGIALKQINMRDVRLLPILLPPLALQQQFADKISAIEAQKELVKQSIAETQALLSYTMDKYFG